LDIQSIKKKWDFPIISKSTHFLRQWPE